MGASSVLQPNRWRLWILFHHRGGFIYTSTIVGASDTLSLRSGGFASSPTEEWRLWSLFHWGVKALSALPEKSGGFKCFRWLTQGMIFDQNLCRWTCLSVTTSQGYYPRQYCDKLCTLSQKWAHPSSSINLLWMKFISDRRYWSMIKSDELTSIGSTRKIFIGGGSGGDPPTLKWDFSQ